MRDKHYKAKAFRLSEETQQWLYSLQKDLGKRWNLVFVYLRILDEKNRKKGQKKQ